MRDHRGNRGVIARQADIGAAQVLFLPAGRRRNGVTDRLSAYRLHLSGARRLIDLVHHLHRPRALRI